MEILKLLGVGGGRPKVGGLGPKGRFGQGEVAFFTPGAFSGNEMRCVWFCIAFATEQKLEICVLYVWQMVVGGTMMNISIGHRWKVDFQRERNAKHIRKANGLIISSERFFCIRRRGVS